MIGDAAWCVLCIDLYVRDAILHVLARCIRLLDAFAFTDFKCNDKSRPHKRRPTIIVQYILDLDSRGFPRRLIAVEDMANQLLAERDASKVGKRWASNFVK